MTYSGLPAFSWDIPGRVDQDLVRKLCDKTGVSAPVGSILMKRNGGDLDAALKFFDENVCSPGDFIPGLDDCVRRLLKAKDTLEKVAIYSDFDVDGVTAAAILKEAFSGVGIDCLVYIPYRDEEGYGFHPESVELLVSQRVSLFVTADCGITGHEACEKAAGLGADVLITDHHLPGPQLPRALSILDPFLPSWSGLNLQNLTGAGVAYLLATAIAEAANIEMPSGWAHDLLTLSIAGDSLPVSGFNRYWIKSGLELLKKAQRPGIRALCEVAGISAVRDPQNRFSFDRDVVFGLVPRLNAAGRMQDANLAYKLLVEEDSDRCTELAEAIDNLNRTRRAVEDTIVKEAQKRVEVEQYAVCAWDRHWHPGVIGIACSKLREASLRPVALAAGEGDVLKGSVRGVQGFHAQRALSQCRDLLVGFGGHEFAAGFTVEQCMVQQFFDRFTRETEAMLSNTDLTPTLNVDSIMDFSQIDDENLWQFMSLEPFGQGNPVPNLVSLDINVKSVRFVGKTQKHVQLTLGKGNHEKRFIWFGKGELAKSLASWGRADVLFVPYRNVYLGREEISLSVRDMRPASAIMGHMYDDIFREAPQDRPLVVYTWSEGAAKALRNSAQRLGRNAVIHTTAAKGALAHNAKLALHKPHGIVISTSPWTLPKPEGLSPALLVCHPPVRAHDMANLLETIEETEFAAVYPQWEQDSRMWMDFQYLTKGCVGELWKYLMASFPQRTFPLVELGALWEDIPGLSCFQVGTGEVRRCWEAYRQILRSAMNMFGDLGLIGYTQNRRQPELVLNQVSGKISLSASPLFVEGQALRDSWQSLCEKFANRDLSLWRV